MRTITARRQSPRLLAPAATLMALCSLGASTVSSAQDEAPASDAAAAGEPRRGPTDPAEVDAFLSGLMAAHLKDHTIVGATVAVVRDGQVLFSAGYGFADKEKHIPVDPERTLFRIGSVSKLFTWTAVMQQVEEGNLDLDTDVNEYLDFEIPPTYPEPITLTNLLTHTPGFEDRAIGLFGESDVSRREYLEQHLPARVRPPGTFSSYSNYGTSLAGYIIERVSGMSWEDYIDRHILGPLGMKYATGHQPLPEEIADAMSVGYAAQGGEPVAKDFEMIVGSAPAGAVSASAGAMAKFMIAHLQYGRYGDQRILEEETAREMYQRLFAHDERLPGMAHGFYEQDSHGLHLIGHGGDTGWFHTDLSLCHSESFGVFVSYNTSSGGQLSFRPFLEAFLDHYYPVEQEPSTVDVPAAELQHYAGTYRMNRGSHTTVEKAFGLLGAPAIAASEDGTLLVTSPLGKVHFAPIESGIFHEVDGTDLLAFREDDSGRVTHAFLGSLPFMTMEKLSALQSPRLHLPLLVVALVAFLITLLALPVRALLRRRYAEVRPDSKPEGRARWIAWLVALVNLAFVGGLAAVLSSTNSIIEGQVGALGAVLTLGVLAALLTVGVLVCLVLAWKDRYWTLWGRLRYTLFGALAIVYLLILNYWNLIGWKLG